MRVWLHRHPSEELWRRRGNYGQRRSSPLQAANTQPPSVQQRKLGRLQICCKKRAQTELKMLCQPMTYSNSNTVLFIVHRKHNDIHICEQLQTLSAMHYFITADDFYTLRFFFSKYDEVRKIVNISEALNRNSIFSACSLGGVPLFIQYSFFIVTIVMVGFVLEIIRFFFG